ncbi:outer membrane protein assembly factor BamB, partial [Francisella tularensis subsp. holarctica]|nr:outer membrane protein assembly factor BamB [Francisella tularensis subsp. holarctica]
TQQGHRPEAETGTPSIVEATRNKVLYARRVSDYQVDKGKSGARIYPLEHDKPTKAPAPVATNTPQTTETQAQGSHAT